MELVINTKTSKGAKLLLQYMVYILMFQSCRLATNREFPSPLWSSVKFYQLTSCYLWTVKQTFPLFITCFFACLKHVQRNPYVRLNSHIKTPNYYMHGEPNARRWVDPDCKATDLYSSQFFNIECRYIHSESFRSLISVDWFTSLCFSRTSLFNVCHALQNY